MCFFKFHVFFFPNLTWTWTEIIKQSCHRSFKSDPSLHIHCYIRSQYYCCTSLLTALPVCTYLLFPPNLQCLVGVFLQKHNILLLKPNCKKNPSTDYKFLHFLASILHHLILVSLLLKPSSTFIKCLLPSLKLLLYNSSVIPLALWHCVDMKCPPSSPQPERCLILGSNSTDFIKFSLNSSNKI